MDVKQEFTHLYRRKRAAGINPGRAHHSALQAIYEMLINFSAINLEPITSEQLQQLETVKKDRQFLQMLEDTIGMTPEQLQLYKSYLKPRLQLVK